MKTQRLSSIGRALKHTPLTPLLLALLAFSCGKKKATDSEEKRPTITPPVQVTTTGGTEPAISPDGDYLAYVGPGGILRARVDGSQVDTLANYGSAPDWSRANNKIVAVDTGGRLFTIDPSNKQITPLAGRRGFEPASAPSGNEIAVSYGNQIRIVAYPSGDTSSIAGAYGEEPTWSFDSQWLAFSDGDYISKTLREGGNASQTLVNTVDGSSYYNNRPAPAWSPDGKWIAFKALEVKHEGDCLIWGGESIVFPSCILWSKTWFSRSIWVVDARGEKFGLWRVTPGCNCSTSKYQDSNPAWSPDSKFIYFSSNRSGRFEIWKVGFSF